MTKVMSLPKSNDRDRNVKSARTLWSADAQARAFMRLFTRVNTILGGKRMPTELGLTPSGCPAATNGEVVIFDRNWVINKVVSVIDRTTDAGVAKRRVAMIKGINGHELGHTLFSPSRQGSKFSYALSAQCLNNGLTERQVWAAGNMLEDQRIEALLLAEFPGFKGYLRSATYETLIDGQSGDPDHDAAIGFFWTHGRWFLSRKLRLAQRDAAVAKYGQALVDEWMEVVDEYSTLLVDDSLECDRAARCVIRAHKVLEKAGLSMEFPEMGKSAPGNDSNRGSFSQSRQQEARDKARAEQAQSKSEDEAEAERQRGKGKGDDNEGEGDESESEGGSGSEGDDDEPADDEGEGSGSGDGSEEDGESEGEGESGDDGEGDGAGADGESEGEGDGPSNEDGEEGNGAGYSPHEASDAVTYTDALDDLHDDREFSRELSNLLSEFKAEAEKGDVEKPKKSRTGQRCTPTVEEAGVANRLYRILATMRSNAGHSYDRHLDHGKINVLDFVTRKPWELDVFEKHEDGHDDEFDMEVVCLLDMSLSMRGRSKDASLALWQIKLAMQRLGINVTAYGYNDGEGKCLIDPNSYVKSTEYEDFGTGGGGTDPLDALTKAYNIFTRTAAKRKVLVTITDGDWNSQTVARSDAIVQKIGGLPMTTTILIGIGGVVGHSAESFHQHQFGCDVGSEPERILDVFKEYVLRVARSAARM